MEDKNLSTSYKVETDRRPVFVGLFFYFFICAISIITIMLKGNLGDAVGNDRPTLYMMTATGVIILALFALFIRMALKKNLLDIHPTHLVLYPLFSRSYEIHRDTIVQIRQSYTGKNMDVEILTAKSVKPEKHDDFKTHFCRGRIKNTPEEVNARLQNFGEQMNRQAHRD